MMAVNNDGLYMLLRNLYNAQFISASVKEKKKPKTLLGKIWHFIWHDNSLLSWAVNIVLAILIIKFIFYPGVGLIFGTQYPIVAVVSNSMEHDGNLDTWWSVNKPFYVEKGITREDFEQYPFPNGFHKGDIMILFGTEKEKMKIGDVVVFRSQKPYPIIHRVVALHEASFETKGDNNQRQITPPYDLQLNEKNISYDDLLGKAVIRIPYLGWIKIGFVNFLDWIGIL